MNKVTRRRLWLSAFAVVVGVTVGLGVGHYNALNRRESATKLMPVRIIALAPGEASPLGERHVVLKEDAVGRLLVAPPGGPQTIAVFEPAAGASDDLSIRRMFEWVNATPRVLTVYMTKPKVAAEPARDKP